MLDIPLLTQADIDVRVATVKEGKGFSLLLYKDARVDMRILDQLFGQFGWRREHGVVNGNLFCTVAVYDKDTQQWVSKQDVGTESNTEKQKGEASDAFKRACFNWGIGRELYTAPFIWVQESKGGKFDKYAVTRIEYSPQREISFLEIVNNKTNAVVYTFGKPSGKQTAPPKQPPAQRTRRQEVAARAKAVGLPAQSVADLIKSSYNREKVDDLTPDEYDDLLAIIDNHRREAA